MGQRPWVPEGNITTEWLEVASAMNTLRRSYSAYDIRVLYGQTAAELQELLDELQAGKEGPHLTTKTFEEAEAERTAPGGDHDQPYFYSSPIDWARTPPLASLVSRLARGQHKGAIFGGPTDGQLAIEAPKEDES
jgi:hypothetical protein